MQFSTSSILGKPGVDKTKLPDLRNTVFFKPASIMYSLVLLMNEESIPVASNIFSQ
ncbi:hypothetical protein [Thomasclavelia ramosa]|uniref:hypothetical protein n=1 Tax=Thomasclavelia ramosa TaxID=1547 RepID=UPI0013145E50|nr:hypothetical protein [Thomasclavelia ramosa]